MVIELKGTAHPQTVLNYLYKHTQLEETFHYNVVALVDGVPQTLSLKEILEHYIAHRKVVVTRRTSSTSTKLLRVNTSCLASRKRSITSTRSSPSSRRVVRVDDAARRPHEEV